MKCPELKSTDPLYQNVEKTIDRVKAKKRKYVFTYKVTKFLVFLAGATITVLSGWNKPDNADFNPGNLILIISAIITLSAAVEGLFDLKDKAMSYDILLFELRKLRDKMCFDFYKVSKDMRLFEEKKEEYFKEFQEILQSQKSIIANSYDMEE